ncbi:hypothetical protein CRG98_009244 [Punica granatum]|uniref:Uncharacterized protein n=1 Tax=Punica granatum TaxID=22663 RepID=A0A2I0KPE8_PUNGR|nr:hypothetical protein CRG98_009244 [Punica granatum]
MELNQQELGQGRGTARAGTWGMKRMPSDSISGKSGSAVGEDRPLAGSGSSFSSAMRMSRLQPAADWYRACGRRTLFVSVGTQCCGEDGEARVISCYASWLRGLSSPLILNTDFPLGKHYNRPIKLFST